MQKETRQGQRKEVVSDEPLNWPAKVVDGVLVIEPICEEIPNENGGQDVIVKVPSLRLLNTFKNEHNISKHIIT